MTQSIKSTVDFQQHRLAEVAAIGWAARQYEKLWHLSDQALPAHK